jgi:hypothetical protein
VKEEDIFPKEALGVDLEDRGSERGYELRGRIKWAWQCKRDDRRRSNIQTSFV